MPLHGILELKMEVLLELCEDLTLALPDLLRSVMQVPMDARGTCPS
jgi:hypothetical protein